MVPRRQASCCALSPRSLRNSGLPCGERVRNGDLIELHEHKSDFKSSKSTAFRRRLVLLAFQAFTFFHPCRIASKFSSLRGRF